MRERREQLPIPRNRHLLQWTNPNPQLMHPILLHHHNTITHPKKHLHIPRHRVLRLNYRDAERVLLQPRVRELARDGVLEIGDAEDLIGLREANHPIRPEDAFDDVLFEAVLAHGEVGFDELGVDVVAVDGAVLDDGDEGLVVGPGEADEAAAGAVPDGGGEGFAGGVEDVELPAGGFREKLDDLGVVADDGDRTAKGGGGDAVAGEVHALPLHGVDFRLTVVAVVEELPLGSDGDGRH